MSDKKPAIDLDELNHKIDKMGASLQQLVLLQRFALLGEAKIAEFVHDDKVIRLHVPYAMDDYIQRVILSTSAFYEDAMLRKLRKMEIFDEKGRYFDVGANIGNHTVFFGAVMGAAHLTSFEPQDVAHSILRRNVALNNLSETTTMVKKLIGSKVGHADMSVHFGSRNLGATAFAEADQGAFAMTTLDDYCVQAGISSLDFLKIDVEGMQELLLAGAPQLLGDMKPVIWIELREPLGEFAGANAILGKYGYTSTRLGPHDYVFSVT